MSGVRILPLFKRLMEIHSNPPILYYGFNPNIWFIILKFCYSQVSLFQKVQYSNHSNGSSILKKPKNRAITRCLEPTGVDDLYLLSNIAYPDNSPQGQFPTVHVLVLMSGFTGLLWSWWELSYG